MIAAVAAWIVTPAEIESWCVFQFRAQMSQMPVIPQTLTWEYGSRFRRPPFRSASQRRASACSTSAFSPWPSKTSRFITWVLQLARHAAVFNMPLTGFHSLIEGLTVKVQNRAASANQSCSSPRNTTLEPRKSSAVWKLLWSWDELRVASPPPAPTAGGYRGKRGLRNPSVSDFIAFIRSGGGLL